MSRWELAVVGAGPAGIAAACEAARLGVEPLLLEAGRPGGTIRVAHEVRNVPFLAEDSTGERVAAQLAGFLDRWGVRGRRTEVASIRCKDTWFVLETRDGERFEAERVVLATGTTPLFPSIEGMPAHHPRFVGSAPAACELATPKSAVVIGGSDVAMDQARWLRKRGARVEVLVRRSLRAPEWLARAALREGVVVSLGASAIRARASESGISLMVRQHGQATERHVDAVVSAIGRRAVVLEGAATAMDARPRKIRVVGDGTGRRARHVVAALGDGCVAAAELLALPAGGT